jgi:hypothetical protein
MVDRFSRRTIVHSVKASTTPRHVLTVTEAREAAPRLAREFRDKGIAGGVVFFGSHRRPDAAIVPGELLEVLEPFLEDLVIAQRVRVRAAEGSEALSLAELDAAVGFDTDEVELATTELRRELGLGT